jgi:hypothetical protein
MKLRIVECVKVIIRLKCIIKTKCTKKKETRQNRTLNTNIVFYNLYVHYQKKISLYKHHYTVYKSHKKWVFLLSFNLRARYKWFVYHHLLRTWWIRTFWVVISRNTFTSFFWLPSFSTRTLTVIIRFLFNNPKMHLHFTIECYQLLW